MKLIPQTPAEARQSHLESATWRRLLLWGLKNVPVSLQDATMPLWAAFFYFQVPHIRQAIELNLHQLLGIRSTQLHLLAFRTFTHYCQSIANTYRLHLGGRMRLLSQITGAEVLDNVIASGKGAILATGHVGNWQLGPYYLAQHKMPPLTMVMSEEPHPDTQHIEAMLRDKKWRVVYPGRSPWLNLELRAALGRGELVGFQMDRPWAKRALAVPFAGGQASFALGPALLAHICKVPVVPVFFPMTDNGISILVGSPLWSQYTDQPREDMTEITCRLAKIYERVVFNYPDQWFNFYHFWVDTRQMNNSG